MMKIITCFIPQTEGTVEVCGFDVETQSMNVRRNVGYLPEHNPLYLDMYVKEYLSFVAGLHKLKKIRNRVDEMVDMVGLTLESRKKIGALSKGYRQRVGLAQALIHDPKVLILDEPTSGLDPNQIGEIRNLIRNVGKEKTVMMSTHIMQEVEAICDRVIIINRGNLVADDSAKDLRQVQQNTRVFVVEFSGKVYKDQLLGIDGVDAVKQMEGNNWQLKSRDGKDVRHDVFQLAVKSKLTVLTMNEEEQRMEEVFKKLTSN